MSRDDLVGNQELETRHHGPVHCLGMTFPNEEEERRNHFLEKLREKLHR